MVTFWLDVFVQKISLNIVTLCANFQIHFSQNLLSLTYDRVILTGRFALWVNIYQPAANM